MNYILKILKFILLTIGTLFCLWGVLCFLGGPDGRIFSLDSIFWGTSYTAIGLFIIGITRIKIKKIVNKAFKRDAKRSRHL